MAVSESPSRSPSLSPSRSPSKSPSLSPSISPSLSPSRSPSKSKSLSPSKSPSLSPSSSLSPSASPSSISSSSWPESLPMPDYALEEEYYKPQIRTEFEAGYVQSRPRVTKARRRWKNLGWEVLSEANYATLESFFQTNQGDSFEWVHPSSSVTYNCRFSEDSIKSQFLMTGWRAHVRLAIEEI